MTTTTKPRQLPWLKYSREVDAQIAAGIARELTQGGARTYRDAGSSERYIVGYGGERTYAQPAARPAKDFTSSPAQIRFLENLLAEREHTYTDAQIAEGKADWRKIRPMLDELKVSARRDPRARQAEPKAEVAPEAPARARLDFKSIPEGNYALPGEDGDIKFYRVSRTRGGFTKVQARASDDLWDIDNTKVSVAILHKIVAFGLAESQMLFATKLERCYKCYRSLTDKISRERGMGDECASK